MKKINPLEKKKKKKINNLMCYLTSKFSYF